MKKIIASIVFSTLSTVAMATPTVTDYTQCKLAGSLATDTILNQLAVKDATKANGSVYRGTLASLSQLYAIRDDDNAAAGIALNYLIRNGNVYTGMTQVSYVGTIIEGECIADTSKRESGLTADAVAKRHFTPDAFAAERALERHQKTLKEQSI